MNLEEVTRVLNDIYKEPLLHEKKRHIVFWYDADGEFIEDIDALNLDNVRTLKLNENNYFYTRGFEASDVFSKAFKITCNLFYYNKTIKSINF